MSPFDAQRSKALSRLGSIHAAVVAYQDLLGRASAIRAESPGEPYYLTQLLRAYDELSRSLQEATRLAVI